MDKEFVLFFVSPSFSQYLKDSTNANEKEPGETEGWTYQGVDRIVDIVSFLSMKKNIHSSKNLSSQCLLNSSQLNSGKG